VNISDFTRPIRRVLGARAETVSETTYKSFRSLSWKSPSPYAFLCWVSMASILLFMVSGCGASKEELENAKQQIERLNSEVKTLTQETARLNQEKSSLSEDSKTLSEKNTRIQRELDDLSKAKATLSSDNKEIKKKNSVAEEELASLKREKAQLALEVEGLKKRVAETGPPPKSPAAIPTEVGAQRARKPEDLSPCDAVVAFMKASEGIVKQHKGTERMELLEQVKQQYEPRMKGAPEKARKAAEDWVKEGVKLWDQSHGDGVFRLLQLRNTVLEACGKSPDGAGFK
jgi:uncharacterized protein YoxC